MGNISLASKVAIAFIRPFRSYLDGQILIKNSRKELEDSFKSRLEEHAARAKINHPEQEENISRNIRNLILINTRILDSYDVSYEKVLPNFVEDLTSILEQELNKSFSQEELSELILLLEKPLMHRLLSNTVLFGALKKCELELEYKFRTEIFDNVLSPQSIDKIEGLFNKTERERDIEETDDGYDDNIFDPEK